MKWDQLISSLRLGMETYKDEHLHDRTNFQRDYDRLIFSAPFRRLQNKTQVFPLPGSIFVHNRLTHSLEVASVGRSLGDVASQLLQKKYSAEIHPALNAMGQIVSTACLAHDLGNPPFGHSGEEAIMAYFREGAGKQYEYRVTPEQWKDFLHFEGNANTFRVLTHQFKGRRSGGYAMTYSTLASIVKYPYASVHTGVKGKFGFFCSEQEQFQRIASELGIIQYDVSEMRFARYPLVYLVEAADDICYQVMDIEDAFKLKILSCEETIMLYMNYFEQERKDRMHKTIEMLGDENEKIAYLRSCVIGKLVNETATIFVEGEQEILNGTFKSSLIRSLPEVSLKAYELCTQIAADRIYRSKEVINVEIAGYKIITTLLDLSLQAIFNPNDSYSKLILRGIPSQYDTEVMGDYEKIQCALDYLSGMTDVYALDLYRKINGMSLPAL